MKETIGSRIKTRRKLLNMTQEKLGEAVGVTKQAIYQWEHDLNKSFKSDEFDKLVVALETTSAYLKSGIDNLENKITNAYLPAQKDYEKLALELLSKMTSFQRTEWLAIGKKMAEEADRFRKALLPDFKNGDYK